MSGNATGTGGLGGDGAPNGADLPGGVGGGIDTEGDATLRNATVANNAAAGAGGIFAEGGNMSEAGSVVAANHPYNCGGTFLDDGHNLTFGDATCPGPEAGPEARGRSETNRWGHADDRSGYWQRRVVDLDPARIRVSADRSAEASRARRARAATPVPTSSRHRS